MKPLILLLNQKVIFMRNAYNKPSGFTLIEVIVGIVALSISLSMVVSFIAPTEQHSADQIHQVKAAELAQSLMNEIMGKAYDDNSDMAGGRMRCDDPSYVPCTTSRGYEIGETRKVFDDVDDYNGYQELKNSTEDNLAEGYDRFLIVVAVKDDTADVLKLGLSPNGKPLAKKITITVTTPLGTAIEFASYRANF